MLQSLTVLLYIWLLSARLTKSRTLQVSYSKCLSPAARSNLFWLLGYFIELISLYKVYGWIPCSKSSNTIRTWLSWAHTNQLEFVKSTHSLALSRAGHSFILSFLGLTFFRKVWKGNMKSLFSPLLPFRKSVPACLISNCSHCFCKLYCVLYSEL